MTNDIQWPAWQDVQWSATPRNEERLLVAVDVEPQSTEIAGQHVPRGLHFRIIYKSQLAAVQTSVRSDRQREMMARAQEQYEHELAGFAKSNTRGDMDLARAMFGRSPQSIYDDLPGGKGGVPPLLSLAVHPTPVPAPHTPESTAAQQSDALVKALQEVIRAGQRGDKRNG